MHCRADKYSCEALRAAAIPMAATNIDSLDLDTAAKLPFEDMRDIFGSDHLVIEDVSTPKKSCACCL